MNWGQAFVTVIARIDDLPVNAAAPDVWETPRPT